MGVYSLAVAEPTGVVGGSDDAPIIWSYNQKIRPLLDCVDTLRNLKVTQEGIRLPTIVVVGDQSSGKSSVLESLAGISLPRAEGICTRVPLIMRLQSDNNNTSHHPEMMTLEFNGKVVQTGYDSVADAIILATNEIAGESKAISNTPLTITVKKSGVPDLTMVDLPGITRVPVHGQPDDIYEQISEIIMEYIEPEESIILNVLSATVDFTTCESIRMSKKVDKTGERTLAVVTKPDRAPEGLLEKVTANDVNIGLGYVVVRNRIGNESFEEAREEEALLFETHPLLSKISKSMIGVPVLAQKLVQIQGTIISKCLPEIIRSINDKLDINLSELEKMPQSLTSEREAMRVFMHIVSSAKESLKKIFIRGEIDEFPEDKHKHCMARVADMLTQYANDLRAKCIEPNEDFLKQEIDVLEESKGVWLPNFLSRAAFTTLLRIKVNSISSIPVEFLNKVWTYVGSVLVPILLEQFEHYPQLQISMRRATQSLMSMKKNQSIEFFMEIMKMEKLTDYTCHPEYISNWNNLMKKQDEFMNILTSPWSSTIMIDGLGQIEVGHLRQHHAIAQQAFDLKMRMIAYWEIVLRRLVDSMALHINFSIQNLINNEMEEEITKYLYETSGLERMLEEPSGVTDKRSRLNQSIKLLQESKDVIAKSIDKDLYEMEEEFTKDLYEMENMPQVPGNR